MNASVAAPQPVPIAERRNQTVAHKVADEAHRYRCCVICGLQTCLQMTHLDHNAGNNLPTTSPISALPTTRCSTAGSTRSPA